MVQWLVSVTPVGFRSEVVSVCDSDMGKCGVVVWCKGSYVGYEGVVDGL